MTVVESAAPVGSAPYRVTTLSQPTRSRNCTSAPAETTSRTVNPAVCPTAVVPSAPLVTDHVVPATLVMVISSAGSAGSATWNWVGGVALLLAAGNPDDDATVHVS